MQSAPLAAPAFRLSEHRILTLECRALGPEVPQGWKQPPSVHKRSPDPHVLYRAFMALHEFNS